MTPSTAASVIPGISRRMCACILLSRTHGRGSPSCAAPGGTCPPRRCTRESVDSQLAWERTSERSAQCGRGALDVVVLEFKGQGPGLVNVLWVNTHTLVMRDTRTHATRLLTRARTRDGWERRRVAETQHSGDVAADTAAVAWAVVSAATGGEVAQRRGGAAAERAGRGGGGEVGGRAVAAFLLEHTRTHSTQSARARAP